MSNVLSILRLPLFILGMVLLFAADRYFGAESYHMAMRAAAFVLMAVGLVATFLLAAAANGRGLVDEAKCWQKATLWQGVVLVSMGLYLAYRKSVGDTPSVDSVGAKVLLAAWLITLIVGIAAGIGTEWAMRDAGRGETAEPVRVTRAGLSMAGIGLLLCFLVTVNYVADKKDITRDWSYLKVRSPSASTRGMLKSVSEDLKISLFYPQGNEVLDGISDYFSQVASAEPKIKLEFYDKDMHPTQAEEQKVSRNGQIVLDYKGKKSRIDTGTTISKARKTMKDLDQEFQKAFLEISSDRKTLYFTRGHGEGSWVGESGDNPMRSLKLIEGFLRTQNYSTRLLGVAEGSATAVPEDAAAVVIVGPTEPFQPEEVAAIRQYVEGGGNLMVFLDVQGPSGAISMGGTEQPLMALLGEMGIKYNAVPLANDKNHVAASRSESDIWFIFSNIFTSHDSVVSLARHDERVAILLYQTGYLTVTPDTPMWSTFETVRALSDTYADTNKNFRMDGDEKRDSYVLGAVSQLKRKKTDDPTKKDVKNGRVAVFADATSLSDGLVRNVGNAIYFADTLKWLVGDSEMAGEVASEEDVKIRHTSQQDDLWFFGSVFAVPLLVIGAGFVATRRKRGGKEKGKTDAA